MSRENCIVCEEKIYRSTYGGVSKLRRGKNNLTCSRKCSKIYNRIYKYFYKKYLTK